MVDKCRQRLAILGHSVTYFSMLLYWSRIGHRSVSFRDLLVSLVTDIIQRKNSCNTLIL
jgi:hypothetical protein